MILGNFLNTVASHWCDILKRKACTYVHCNINLQEHITAVTLYFLEDAFLRHKFADNGLENA
jgi:hypothetical protein